jgi:catechol 2,3-dioxygenase-like lactoylglutathione lyase family enzyme
MNLNQVTVPALDVEASIVFYRRLGLKLIVHSEHYARFECPKGDSTFSLHRTEERPEGQTVVYFEVDDLDQTYEDLRASGLEFLTPPTRERWLWYEARLEDPSGNSVCVYSAGENRKNPPWRID